MNQNEVNSQDAFIQCLCKRKVEILQCHHKNLIFSKWYAALSLTVSLIYTSGLCFWVHRLYVCHCVFSGAHGGWLAICGLAVTGCVGRGPWPCSPIALLQFVNIVIAAGVGCGRLGCAARAKRCFFVCCETKPARSREQHIQLSRRNFINFILRCAARETRHAEPAKGNFGHGLGLCGSRASTSRFPPLCRLRCEFYF